MSNRSSLTDKTIRLLQSGDVFVQLYAVDVCGPFIFEETPADVCSSLIAATFHTFFSGWLAFLAICGTLLALPNSRTLGIN